MGTIVIAAFTDEAKAAPLKHRLEQSHIPARLERVPPLERLWFVDTSGAGVRVRVPLRDHARALEVVRAWDEASGVLHHAVHCPECGSLHVEYPQFTRKFLLPNLVGLLSALRIVPKKYYCEDCHCTWPKEGNRPDRPRAHMAPYYFIEGVGGPNQQAVGRPGGF